MIIHRKFACALWALAAFAALAVPLREAAAQLDMPGQKARVKAERPSAIRRPDDLDLVDVGKVTKVGKSDMISLDSGNTYRLANVRTPVFYEDKAVEYLTQAILGRTVGIYVNKKNKTQDKDRDGNIYVSVLRDDGLWIQEDMIGHGLAWAFSTEFSRVLVVPLYKQEAQAQKMRVGFWTDPEYLPKSPQAIHRYINTYQMYKCWIGAVGFINDTISFNCDIQADGSSSLIVAIPKTNLSNFTLEKFYGAYFNTWRDAVVIVRGWVEKGMDPARREAVPQITVTHPEQLDFIDAKTGESTTKIR